MSNLWLLCVCLILFYGVTESSRHAGRLFEDLLAYYNRLVRPVIEDRDAVRIQFKLKLLQILDVHEKNQVVTVNGWLIHLWEDYRLRWDPLEYDNVTVMHVPAELIWLPDIILYNNADGSPQVTTLTKAHVYYSGRVVWEPPVIYNSMCQIDIEWFPYDQQFCEMKFGSWTYYGHMLDMAHLDTDDVIEVKEGKNTIWRVEIGIDIAEFQESGEWDLMSVVGARHEKWYPCCDYPYVDMTYYINIRRKTLFFTINLMIPCMGLTFLTCLVFYLPSDCNNKITLCVSVLVSLTVFFLLLIEMIPPTSLKIPLIARYLLFTMVMVTCSVCCTVLVLNIHYRSSAKPLPECMSKIFIDWLPKLLIIARPARFDILKEKYAVLDNQKVMSSFFTETVPMLMRQRHKDLVTHQITSHIEAYKKKAFQNICYIAKELKQRHNEDTIKDDWKFAAIVVDRIFLLLFSVCSLLGTTYCLLAAPTITDNRIPITDILKQYNYILPANFSLNATN